MEKKLTKETDNYLTERKYDKNKIITAAELKAEFEQMLNTVYQDKKRVKIFGLEFKVAEILKECDPATYDMAYDEYVKDLLDNGKLVCLGEWGKFLKLA